MNNPRNILLRWSRRKHAAAVEIEKTTPSVASSPAASEEAVGSERTAGAERLDCDGRILPSTAPNTSAPQFDPLSVPAIESITADTDIRGFLAPGVPPELTRVALRRTWAADPKIRDFVGLADYDWDFNAPGSMAGFGSLEMTDELRRVAAQIVRPAANETTRILNPASVKTTSDQTSCEPDLVTQMQPIGHEDDHIGLATNAFTEKPVEPVKRTDLTHCDQEGDSVQCRSRKRETSQLIVRQSHGGALPK
jgi:hypothetical protein